MRRTILNLAAVAGMFPNIALAYQTSKSDLAFGLGFSINAQGACDDLTVNLKTVESVIAGLGSDPREVGSQYNSEYRAGLDAAWKDADVCSSAWTYYGCEGERISRLIMESPFSNPNAKTCFLPVLNWDE